MRGISQGALSELFAITHVSKHGNFIERSRNIRKPSENRKKDQMIGGVETVRVKRSREGKGEAFSQCVEILRA